MSKQKQAILIAVGLIFVFWLLPIFAQEDDPVLILLSLILLPILAVSFHRVSHNVSIEKINKVFRFFVWFFILLYLAGTVSFFVSEYPYGMPWLTMEDALLFMFSPVLVLVSFAVMIKTNDAWILKRKLSYCQIFFGFFKKYLSFIFIILGISILVKYIFGLFIFYPEVENIITFASALLALGILLERNRK